MNLLKYIWRKRKFIAVVSILITLGYYGVNCFYTYYSESGTISFIYPNSENGRYPDGTRFNIYDLMAPEVLEGTVEIYNERTGNIPIKLSDIEGAIQIDEIVPYGMHTKVQEARNSGQDYSYFANEYRVSIAPVKGIYKRSSKNLFGFVPDVNNKLLIESLYKSYTDYFMNSHAEMNIIPKITQTMTYDGYDYIEIANVFEARIDMYITYLESKIRENGAYRSEATGKSFNDLVAEFRNLRDIKVKNLKSFVSSSKLAKNPTEFINKLKVQNESYTLYYNKLADEAEAARIAMNEYDHTYEENIIITGQNEEVGLYQAKPKTAYDTITKRALDVGVSAQAVLKDIEENDRLINEYTNTYMSEETQKRLSAVADILVDEIEAESDRLVEVADQTISDYLDSRCSDYMRFTRSPKSYFSMNLFIKMIIVFMFSVIGAVLYLYLIDKEKKPGVQEITEALGIRTSKRKLIIDMLIKLENKIIIKREQKQQKAMRKKGHSGAVNLNSQNSVELNENTKGYIETFFAEQEKKQKIKMQKKLAHEEAKRAKRKKNNKSVYNIDIFDKISDIMNHEIAENDTYKVAVPAEYDGTENSALGDARYEEELFNNIKVKPEELSALLEFNESQNNKDARNSNAESKAIKESVDLQTKESRDIEINNILFNDIDGRELVEKECRNLEHNEINAAELKDIEEIGSVSSSKLGNYEILGGIRDKINEILESQTSIIDELLEGKTSDDLVDESGIDKLDN